MWTGCFHTVIADLWFAYTLLYLSHPWALDKELKYLQNYRIVLSVHTVKSHCLSTLVHHHSVGAWRR